VEAGAGEPVLLIMGFGGDHTAWAFQMGAFSAHHRVIAFDNRGVGQTEAPDHAYTTR
jgi:3-oxoadipate enol-lactonase